MDKGSLHVAGVGKQFILPHHKTTSIKGAFVNVFRPKDSGVEVQQALKDISFTIQPGEFFGILGRNGSGKSTLLKILAGIYTPTDGSVTVNGKLVPFIELGVGFNPELTGRENIFLNGALLGFSREEIADRYDQIVAFAELERFIDQKLKNYSSGMQVRLAFSVAIMSEADILLVDEVLAVGDADFQRKCFAYFETLKKTKKTVVFVSHDMQAVRQFCDRAVLIENSRLVLEGSADDVADEYTKLFIEKEDTVADKPSGETKRTGDGAVQVEAVSVTPTRVSGQDETVEISVTIVATQDVDEPICGFLVKDAADHRLFGTNTRIKRKKLGALQQGDRRTILWRMPNIFADGKHYIDVTVEHNDGISVYDWWEDATTLTVHKTEKTAYHITPPIQVDIS